MRPIVFVPQGGLCNRMRAVVSAVNLAVRLERNLKIVWTVSSECGAGFEDVFRRVLLDGLPAGVQVQSVRLPSRIAWRVRTAIRALSVRVGWRWFSNFKRDDFDALNPEALRGEKIVVESGYSFCPAVGDAVLMRRLFRFREEIEAKAAKLVDGEAIGVHIRRTDNSVSIAASPLRLFEKAIRDRLRTAPDRRFYLATDSEDVAERLKSMFGEAIVMQEGRSLKRGDRDGIAAAAVDFLALSKCKEILGSYWSSFSDISAEYGGIPLTVLKDEKTAD